MPIPPAQSHQVPEQTLRKQNLSSSLLGFIAHHVQQQSPATAAAATESTRRRAMEEATREQQREARRQKVLARSQEGIGAAVVDHAASQDDVAPQGVSAELDHNEADPSSVPSDAAAVPEDSTKSASRLAAERRRQRILSKSTERMAKVQGDRVIHAAAAGRGESGAEGGAGGGESLDDVSAANTRTLQLCEHLPAWIALLL